MKLKVIFSILSIAFTTNSFAEESPVASPVISPVASQFAELFKTVLTETDFFVCESNISVSTSKKVGDKETKEDVFYFKANKRGKNGSLILKELEISLEGDKLKAIGICKSENSEKDCLTHGLVNNQSKYTEFDYATKKTFLDTLVKSCSETKVTCLSATASKPDCFLVNLEPPQNASKEAVPSPDAAKAPAKK